jgi:hypothetical protein
LQDPVGVGTLIFKIPEIAIVGRGISIVIENKRLHIYYATHIQNFLNFPIVHLLAMNPTVGDTCRLAGRIRIIVGWSRC